MAGDGPGFGPTMVGRTIIVGDVHGCLGELDALLEGVALAPSDRLVFVGDLVDRGPDSVGVIRRVRELFARHPGSVCVAGNHEEKALRFRERAKKNEPWCTSASDEDWAFLDGLPLVARLPDLGALVVHGGLYPRFFEKHGEIGEVPSDWRKGGDKRLERMRRFLRIRTVSEAGEMVALGSETPTSVHWSTRYDGREGYCFFGHDPQLDPAVPLRAPHALGLDTGCCFGGALTAALIEPGSDVRAATFVSVAARSRYAEPRQRGTE